MKEQTKVALALAAVCIVSYIVIYHNYDRPAALFWDENYIVTSAYNYRTHTFFMDSHPPLGKLLIAAGEAWLHPNDALDTSGLSGRSYVKEVPSGFSFRGVRFFPVLLATLAPLLFFLILYTISERWLVSLLFSSLYVLNNAMVMHFRGAMFDGIQMFFVLASLLAFVVLFDKKELRWWQYLALGALIGLAVNVKVNALVLLLLFPALYIREKAGALREASGARGCARAAADLPLKALGALAGLALVTFIVWQVHFSLASNVANYNGMNPSTEYKEILAQGESANPLKFPLMFRDSYAFMQEYADRVPALDECKADENGSPPLAWIAGRKAINYRWEHDGESVRYLYLVANPAILLIGFAGVLLALALIAAHFVYGLPIRHRRYFWLICVFTALYVGYMAAVLPVRRVLYFYHYFIPLVISAIIAYIVFSYCFEERLRRKDKALLAGLAVLAAAVALLFIFYAPFTYYWPLSTQEFLRRSIFAYWGMHYVP